MSSSVPWPHTRLSEHLRYQKSSHTHHVIDGHPSRRRRQSVSKRNQPTQWDHADEQTLQARTARIQNNKNCLKDLPTMSVSLPDHKTLANERNDMTTLDSRSNLRPTWPASIGRSTAPPPQALRIAQQSSFWENVGLKSTFVRNPVTVPQRKGSR